MGETIRITKHDRVNLWASAVTADLMNLLPCYFAGCILGNVDDCATILLKERRQFPSIVLWGCFSAVALNFINLFASKWMEIYSPFCKIYIFFSSSVDLYC